MTRPVHVGKSIFNFYFLLILFPISCCLADRKLAFVQCVWRHGDRAPSGLPYPGDPHDESYWSRGWSQLTNLGMRQMRELGQFLRQRYILDLGFLNAKYNGKEVFVQSSNSGRALTSAQALLSGMFPIIDKSEQFDEETNWQPIPVFSTGPNNELLKPTSFDCPVYDKLKEAVKAQLDSEMREKYRDLFEFLRTDVFKSSTPLSMHKVAKLNDLNREVIHNLAQPEWVQKRWPQYNNSSTLELVTELRRQERISEFKQPELAYLKGGYLLGDWISRAQEVLNGKSPKEAEKAVLYSAHDGTLQALLYSMGLGDDQMIPYASVVCMELYKPKGNDGPMEMDIFYRRSGELIPLELDHCVIEGCNAEKALALLGKNAIFQRKALFEACGNAKDYCDLPSDDDGNEKKGKHENVGNGVMQGYGGFRNLWSAILGVLLAFLVL